MKLIVNGTELTVSNAYTERDKASGVLSAVIEVPYASMDFTALKALFMENEDIITKVLDDESTESWDGFKYSTPPVDTGEQYRIVLTGEEATYQIERTRHLEKTLAEKEASIAQMKQALAEKENEISDLAEAYADMLYASAMEELTGEISAETVTETESEGL